MDHSHLHLDTKAQQFQCHRCNGSANLPPTFSLAALEHIINTFISAHQDCTAPAATGPIHHNGCWNKPRPTKDSWYMAQDGWTYSADYSTRTPRMIKVFHKMSTDCKYDRPDRDTACAGCVHMDMPLVLESAA